MRILQIFVDGFGLGENNPEVNPLIAARTPCLDSLLEGHRLWGRDIVETSQAVLVPLDASLGIEGVPQSATGQTTLWTGVNAAKVEGRHINAYPTIALRQVIKERSIFKTLTDRGCKVTFANAFTKHYHEKVEEGSLKYSASTLSAMAGGLTLRDVVELREGRAVYQDITNDFLRTMGLDIPLVSPAQAGSALARIALEHDFTLYEFFQTDVAGHKQDMERGIALVEMLDKFLQAVLKEFSAKDNLVMITSDHGNLEDVRIKKHTLNPVPLLLIGDYQRLPWQELKGIEEVAGLVLSTVRPTES
ncbi:MAG TPA: metalloenzyme [Verrucomicrobiae bacterium]|nr:metalloenzyme [Verrucomicrobiae bacterium]